MTVFARLEGDNWCFRAWLDGRPKVSFRETYTKKGEKD